MSSSKPEHIIAGLSPIMFYLSGRIDAADRRAALVLASAVGFLAYTLQGIAALGNMAFGSTAAVLGSNPSIAVALVAAGLAGFATYPRTVESETWPSHIFAGTPDFDENVLARLSSEVLLRDDLARFQSDIAILVRSKNRYSGFGMLTLAAASLLFAFGY